MNPLATQRGRVEVSIHPPRRAEFKQPPAVRHRRQWTEEAFDDAETLECLYGDQASQSRMAPFG